MWGVVIEWDYYLWGQKGSDRTLYMGVEEDSN